VTGGIRVESVKRLGFACNFCPRRRHCRFGGFRGRGFCGARCGCYHRGDIVLAPTFILVLIVIL
jgi:hypothetical protein